MSPYLNVKLTAATQLRSSLRVRDLDSSAVDANNVFRSVMQEVLQSSGTKLCPSSLWLRTRDDAKASDHLLQKSALLWEKSNHFLVQIALMLSIWWSYTDAARLKGLCPVRHVARKPILSYTTFIEAG
ncbi:uncharacterized protein RAG0_06894 [Rhynchosporium agropyri]|uniref:Uncharacterized protein n=1 Tax=Rhynchosporium agropyri TaxID=914238 RepID=A0A1E1KJ57_9HELO|nr:uncharacterized protein RAG0_06894 [Rhynchosporium agropyri]